MQMDPGKQETNWKRVEELFPQMLLKPSSEWAAFLESACQGNEELRREVESLLEALEKDGAALEDQATEVAARIAAGSPFPSLIGQQLNSYQIIFLLGKGGMGEVYLARDQRLERQVAIKLLPDAFSRDPQRLARFEREAKLLASLNHPNVASIHGLEEADGKRFLVLELVEGQTLAERLQKGRLPVEEALEVCRQIAEGMEAAHEKGIIHRDLKPANVKINPDGKVKILDFGLAKALADETLPGDAKQSPTISDAMSRAGMILGTAAYMSPEQAKGKAADKRTDICAFGCLLFECLTGKQAFEGETVTETLAAILMGEPDWQALPAGTPRKVKELVHRCLQKDPKHRLHDIVNARLEILEGLAEPTEEIPVAQHFSLRLVISVGAAILLIGILIGLVLANYFRSSSPPISQPAVRSVIKLEPGHWLDGLRWSAPTGFDQPTRTAFTFSSDGRFIIYSAIMGNPEPQAKPQLFLRRSDQLEAKPIPGTEGGISPFLSPDNRWVAYWADGKLMKSSLEGGVPVTICDAREFFFGGTWGSDENIVFTPAENGGLFSVVAEGGKPEILTTPDKNRDEFNHRLPHCLPRGRGLLFTIMRGAPDLHPQIAFMDLKTRNWNVLLDDAADARYVPTGHLAFLRQGTLMAVPFDLGKLKVTGQPMPIIQSVLQALNIGHSYFNTGAGQFSLSDSGSLVYASGGIMPDAKNSLVWVDRKGNEQAVPVIKTSLGHPQISPNGQRIVFNSDYQAWVMDLNRGTTTRLIEESKTLYLLWTRDGKKVVFNCPFHNAGQWNLYWQDADGSQPMGRLATSDSQLRPASFSPDGSTLLIVEYHPDKTGYDILLLDMKSGRISPWLNSQANEAYPEFSPDGRWIAYCSDESGRYEVYVRDRKSVV
jgi:serine/threonine protein kinase